MVKEIWKTIKDYPDYDVSNFGNVFNKKLNKKNKLYNSSGYLITTLRNYIGIKTYKTSRLVAMSFIPNPKNKTQVNHIDGNKSNDNVTNLEWCTRSENMLHAYKLGLCKTGGENSRNCKLNWEKVNFIRNSKLSVKELSEKFNVAQSTIYEVKKIKYWKK